MLVSLLPVFLKFCNEKAKEKKGRRREGREGGDAQQTASEKGTKMPFESESKSEIQI